MAARMTMETIVAAKEAEKIEQSELFAKGADGKENGLLFGAPQKANGAVANAEIDKLVNGHISAFYLGAQPIFEWADGSCKFVKVAEELLLRGRNGGQAFPAVTAYNMDEARRQEFTIYQIQTALKRSASTGVPCSVNFWVQDLLTLKDKVIELCGGNPDVIVELTEFVKASDEPSFPKFASFDEGTAKLLADLRAANVRLSLDDISHINSDPNYPISFEFALTNLDSFSQIKLDIKMMAQIFAELPTVPFADKFAPLEADMTVLETKRQRLSDFMDSVWMVNPDIEVVLELSVVTEEIANRFPKLSPFNREHRILVQGGATNDWAEGLI